MEKLLNITMMFDYYGKLLTKREYDVIDKYYNEDLSLNEIAQICNISKQAVSDSLKRAENKLNEYEQKLGLIEKSKKSQYFLRKIRDDLFSLSPDIKSKEIENIIKEIGDFLNDLEDVENDIWKFVR